MAACSATNAEPDTFAEGACDLLRDLQAEGADPSDPFADDTWAAGISSTAKFSANSSIQVHGTQLELETKSSDAATRVPVEVEALDEACLELGL